MTRVVFAPARTVPDKSALVISTPVRFAFVKMALANLAPMNTDSLKSRPVKSPPDKLTLGPKI